LYRLFEFDSRGAGRCNLALSLHLISDYVPVE